MYHGTLVCPYHVDLVFQCPPPPAGEPNIPSHASYSILKYSEQKCPKDLHQNAAPQETGVNSGNMYVCRVRNGYLK